MHPATGSHEIQISGLFKIAVQKSDRLASSKSLKDIINIPVPPGRSKEALIDYFVQTFKGGRKLEWENERENKLLRALLGCAKNAALEKVLRDGELTFWDAGTKVFVLVPRNSSSALSQYVVKSPIKPSEYIEKIRPGYLLAKENLQGLAAEFTMTEGDITVCDLNGVPREAFFEHLLLQERVIVIKSIRKGIEARNRILKDRLGMLQQGKMPAYDFDRAEEEKYGVKKSSLVSRLRHIFTAQKKYRPEVQALLDEMVELHHYNKFIKQKFNELYTEIESRGIHDSDEGRAAMDRNYGIAIPPKLKKYFKNSDWGLQDFRKLMDALAHGRISEQDLRVVGFDFDGLRARKDAPQKQSRVEDVFKSDIEAEIRAGFDKVFR